MPIYQCSTQAGMLSDELKADLSRAITDAHCEQDIKDAMSLGADVRSHILRMVGFC